MDIAPIKSHRDYRRVLREIEGLMNARRSPRAIGHAAGMGAASYPGSTAPRDLIPFIGRIVCTKCRRAST